MSEHDHDPAIGPSDGSDDDDETLDPIEEIRYEQFRDQHLAWIRDVIATYGWAVQGVIGEGIKHPSFAYTVGLTSFEGHPELLASGLDQSSAARLLNVLGERVRAGERFRDGDWVLDIPPVRRLALVELAEDASEGLLIFANCYYQDPDGPPVRALQVIWCDDHGSMPWEDDWTLAPYSQPLAFPDGRIPGPPPRTSTAPSHANGHPARTQT